MKKIIFLLFLFPSKLFSQSIIIKDIDLVKIKSIISENKFTLVHFWGTWCSPCVKEVPKLIELSKSFDIVKLVSINDPMSSTKQINKILISSNYSDSVSFILDKKIYNKSATKNIKKFTKDICLKCALEDTDFIFSGIYLFEKNGNLVYYNKSSDYIDELELVLKKLMK